MVLNVFESFNIFLNIIFSVNSLFSNVHIISDPVTKSFRKTFWLHTHNVDRTIQTHVDVCIVYIQSKLFRVQLHFIQSTDFFRISPLLNQRHSINRITHNIQSKRIWVQSFGYLVIVSPALVGIATRTWYSVLRYFMFHFFNNSIELLLSELGLAILSCKWKYSLALPFISGEPRQYWNSFFFLHSQSIC